METLFGASWKTSFMGLLGGMFYYFMQEGVTFPTEAKGWGSAIVAAGIYAWGRMQKDANVSNAPNPAPASIVGS